jgi:hypothetical protein
LRVRALGAGGAAVAAEPSAGSWLPTAGEPAGEALMTRKLEGQTATAQNR